MATNNGVDSVIYVSLQLLGRGGQHSKKGRGRKVKENVSDNTIKLF